MTHSFALISVVIPVYRSGDVLPELTSRLIKTFSLLEKPCEIILVEDCGGDGSWEVIRRLAKGDVRIRGYRMSRNYGQHNAILHGVRVAEGDVVVTLDDDLQHPPEEVPKLLGELANGHDVVYAPPASQKHGVMRDLASVMTKRALGQLMGAENARNVCAFRAFRTELRQGFQDYRNPSVNIDVLLAWTTVRFSAVTVRHEERKCGISGYTFRKLLDHAVTMFTGFSVFPLRFSVFLGVVFSFFGFCLGAYALVCWLWYGSVVPGFTFLATITSIFAGTQLLTIGVLGEYVGRVFVRTMNQTQYLVREEVRGSS
ncbi:MAG: glycosyltransferase family 2 protein [Rubripirellula sp.]